MSNYHSQHPGWSRHMYTNPGYVYHTQESREMNTPHQEHIYHQQMEHRSREAFGATGLNHQPRDHRNKKQTKNVRQHSPNKRLKNRSKEIVLEPMEIRRANEAAEETRNHRRRGIQPAREIRERRPNKRDSPLRQQRARRSEVGICTKYFLFVVNFFVFVIGIGLTSLSTYILHIKEKKVNDALDFFLDPSCDMCLMGCVFLVMGFIGLVGTLRENTTFLKTHYCLMVFLLFVQISICILIFVAYYSSDVMDKIFPMESFREAIKKYRDDVDMENLIDSMQKELECCGLSDSDEGFLDWNENPYFTCSPNNTSPERCSVPFSCCKKPKKDAIPNYQCGWKVFTVDKRGLVRPNESTDLTKLNKIGCLRALSDWVEEHALAVGGSLLGVLLPQILQIVLTSNLMRMIQLQKYRWNH